MNKLLTVSLEDRIFLYMSHSWCNIPKNFHTQQPIETDLHWMPVCCDILHHVPCENNTLFQSEWMFILNHNHKPCENNIFYFKVLLASCLCVAAISFNVVYQNHYISFTKLLYFKTFIYFNLFYLLFSLLATLKDL